MLLARTGVSIVRLLGWLASALGLVGIIVGNGLASVVWVLKFNVQARIRDIAALPDGGLDIAAALTDTVGSGITTMSEQVAAVQVAADRLVATPGDAAVTAELSAAIDTFVNGPYAGFRALYLRLRDRAIAVGDAVGRLGSSIPLATIPPALVERLTGIDARMVEIDGSVTYLAQLGSVGVVDSEVASGISERALRAQETLTNVSGLIAEIGQWLEDARARLDERQRRFRRLLTLGTIAASVAGLLFAGLNVLLFQQGRRWSGRR